MAPTAGTVPPPVSWAQRADLLYVIIDVECKDMEHSVTENSFTFKGTNALEADKKYEVTLNFLHPVNPEKVTSKNIGRCVEFTIYKKESGPYWKSLTNDKTKLHFLKANFTKWKNESDDEDDVGGDNFMFNDMLKGGDMANRFDDFNVDDDDDSDDNIPSLSQNDEDDEDNKDAEKKDEEK
ncbi:cytosolic prostaglandin E synthase [Musca autumnalis]|uniref:cytosolic prostaglandin E synthase n=1 Tax=Musca autumnalis TaxID=221902 RepID=UPI003CEB3B7C